MKKNKKGFMLVELLVVLFVLGGITAIIYPSLQNMIREKKSNEMIEESKALEKVLFHYYLNKGAFPNKGLVDETAIDSTTRSIIKKQLVDHGLSETLYDAVKSSFMTIDKSLLPSDLYRRDVSTNHYFFVGETSGVTGYKNELMGKVFSYRGMKDSKGVFYSGSYSK